MTAAELISSVNREKTWTVVRFPDGSWSYGGRPDSPDYVECEVWRIYDADPKRAIRKAQQQRRRLREREAKTENRDDR